jgi:putative restriction endonuclease
LKHRELLDAAHIIPDNMPEGKSTIENGLSLCKLHHSAYDAFIIGVTFPPSPSLKGRGACGRG